jgi:hypothetical protein
MKPMILMIAGLLIGLSGCGGFGAAKAGYKVFKGADASIHPVRDVSPAALQQYQMVSLGEVTTDVGRICPPEVQGEVRARLREAFSDEGFREMFPGGGRVLTAHVVCRFFKEKPLIGKESRLDMLVSLVDAETGQEVAVLYVEGLSDSLRAHGKSDLAKENAKELADYLRKSKRGRR